MWIIFVTIMIYKWIYFNVKNIPEVENQPKLPHFTVVAFNLVNVKEIKGDKPPICPLSSKD